MDPGTHWVHSLLDWQGHRCSLPGSVAWRLSLWMLNKVPISTADGSGARPALLHSSARVGVEEFRGPWLQLFRERRQSL